jgi:hypothetical protein
MNSSSRIAHADGRRLAALALLVSGFLVGASRSQAQGFLTLLAYPEFVNKLYTGEPVGGGEQSPAVAFFNGTVGSRSDASAPTDGTLTLTQLAFGQSVAGFVRRAPDVLFGEAITIGDSDLIPAGADRSYAPDVDPAGGAFYDAAGGSLYFAEVGLVTVTWKDAAENPLEPQTLLVSSLPVQDPYQIYWTEQGEVPRVPTGAPEIDFSSGPRVVVHPNSAIQTDHLWLESDRLKAQGRTGLALLEYRNRTTLQFEGVAVVEVRAYLPAYSDTFDVGSFLEPRNTAPRGDSARALVTKGLADPWPYAHQFDSPDKPINGEILVARPSTDNQAIEVFWMEQDPYGVVWPYELARYGGQWPADFDRSALTRRIYSTHDELGGRTRAPTILMPETPFRFMIHHTPTITTNQVDYVASTRMLQATNSNGRVLLHFWNGATAEFLGIQYLDVRRYLADASLPAAVGGELAPSTEPPADAVPPVVVRGLNEIPDPPGPDYAYQHDIAGPDFGKVFVTRPTTTGTQIELFWMRLGLLGVEWPYVMNRYTADWPTDPAAYQRFVCDTGGVRGPAVQFPAEKNVALMPFQEPTDHVGMAGAGTLTNRSAGLSLLKYAPENRVSFQVVRTVLHNDVGVFNLAAIPWPIGSEITDGYHAGPAPGFIYFPEGDVYDGAIYDGRAGDPLEYRTGQIFGVNEGLLEVWWWNVNDEVQWPSLVKRYQLGWPTTAEQYVIASGKGIGNSAAYPGWEQLEWELYAQDDPGAVGFNPNEEHALRFSGKLYPLRDDLEDIGGSEPYVLMKYRPSGNRWAYRVVQVLDQSAEYPFVYDGTAGELITPPSPLQLMQEQDENTPISGPFWTDRNGDAWARSAGDDGGPADIVMHYYYPDHPSFHYPADYPRPGVGVGVPWLDRGAGTPGTPIDVTHRMSWPDTTDRELRMGETLVKSKFGLPPIDEQPSVEIIYHQAVTNGVGESVKLIDPNEIREVSLAGLPDDIQKSEDGTRTFFTDLPPHLQKRVWHDADQGLLRFKGEFVESNGAVEPQGFLVLNVLTDRDVAALHALSEDPTWAPAVNALALEAAEVIEVPPETESNSLALTAGAATAPGWVTLAFNNNTIGPPEDDVISVAVIYVTCPIYQGELKTLLSDNPFDEKLTMRHTGDFAGRADDYEFRWIWANPGSQDQDPTSPVWAPYTPEPADGVGSVDIVIGGPGAFTLSDHWFRCQYRPLDPSHPCGTEWSAWTPPQLAPGWIKRVLDGINPYEQRFSDYQKNSVNTIVSMIQQAGPRWTGSVPLTQAAANELGLIEVYETVLKRGMELSIESGTPTEDATVNDALLLAASRIADLYMLLGNEAYADASDPTIAYGTDDGVYGTKASSIHCFQNQTASLLEEELGLLRGRDDSLFPTVATYPFYNRLIWNFTQGDGEVAYAANYDIRDEQGVVDGVLDEADSQAYYPQGHGDAWGHYLTAIKGYYRLLRNEHFDWVPRSEEVLVGGVPTSVDYQDERRFARVAAARARTGTEVMNLTYRQAYTEDPSGQYQGYYDGRADRAWGVSEWASRAGQAALFDWVVANAILPPSSTETGIKKIDRTTVAELRELPAAFEAVQSQLRQADLGLNPLGLAKNVVPFDISPSEIDAGKTHFEQVYTRAVQAMNNAVAVFNYANNSTQLLRRQADRIADFQRTIQDLEIDFNNRLIEIFGYPYFEDIGTSKTYPAGYDGPDLYHFAYVDTESLTGVPPPPTRDVTVPFSEIIVDDQFGTLPRVDQSVTFKLSTQGYEMVKPSGWTQRRAPGELQRSLSDLVQTRARFQRALVEYDNLLAQIEDQTALLESQQNLNAQEIKVLNNAQDEQLSLNDQIFKSRENQLKWQKRSRMALLAANALAESLPKIVGIASDVSGALRAAALLAGNAYSEHATQKANKASLAELDDQQAKEAEQSRTNIKLTTLRQIQGIESQMAQIEQLIRSEASMRVELFTMEETVNQAAGAYRAGLARGQRLLEERVRFRQQTASKVQQYRYEDMAFRIFRNDALQKYRAQFDLAARYVYMAAKAYDYETNLREGDSRRPGQDFLTQIMRARTIGEIQDGQPITSTGTGDSGLADPMAQMWGTWSGVLRSQLGFNNPQAETGRFSLRYEFFRIRSRDDTPDPSALWRETLRRHVVPNLLALPEYQRYCVPIPDPANAEPAIVIPFSTTVTFAQNLFGWPLAGGDNNFDSTTFATKIRSVGVWLANYNNLGSGLANTPRVYLVPVGHDVMRTPPETTTDASVIREWKVLDQVLPVPFQLSSGDLLNPLWIPLNDSLAGSLVDLRRFNFLLAYHDAGYNPSQVTSSSRLIGRSVWNTRWLLIIPAGSLLADRDEAIERFIDGPVVLGNRTGNGVSDIKLYFQTYAYPGN